MEGARSGHMTCRRCKLSGDARVDVTLYSGWRRMVATAADRRERNDSGQTNHSFPTGAAAACVRGALLGLGILLSSLQKKSRESGVIAPLLWSSNP